MFRKEPGNREESAQGMIGRKAVATIWMIEVKPLPTFGSIWLHHQSWDSAEKRNDVIRQVYYTSSSLTETWSINCTAKSSVCSASLLSKTVFSEYFIAERCSAQFTFQKEIIVQDHTLVYSGTRQYDHRLTMEIGYQR